ncbi:MAG TPA: hypothetical protein PKC18_06885 [Lacipirellulaceae bacterium]|nr:hypothetical protein [Lacipirellulaceae bacterium]
MKRIDALEQVLVAAEGVLSAREDQMLTRVEWETLADAVRNARGKTAYYVATLARYVLVDAANEDEARSLGQVALHDLYVDLRERHGADVPINILTVRPATSEEIELQRFHDEAMAREPAAPNG